MDPMIANHSIKTLALLNELFGYDVEICGDSMTAAVFCGDHFLYTVSIG